MASRHEHRRHERSQDAGTSDLQIDRARKTGVRVSDEDFTGGPLDVATLEVVAGRVSTHPLVDGWALRPDALSPRRLEVHLDVDLYPGAVESTRLDVRWFEGGDYTVHYLETWDDQTWQCRWDRHPKPGGPTEHFHPPPDAGQDIEPSELGATHHLDVVFTVLEWVSERIERLHDQ